MKSAPTFSLITYGCQMNFSDSEFVAGELAARGWRPVENPEEADAILVNACVVRESAERRAIGRLWQLGPIKRRRPGRIIGVLGCLAQKEGRRLLEKMPHVDLVVGTHDLPNIGNLLERIRRDGERLACTEGIERPSSFSAEPLRRDPLKAMVTIMHGCNNFCSYCIVPFTRGREWSRPAREIIAEVEKIAESGRREVTLLGQNVNSYRDGALDFADLLRRVAEVEGIERIRYVTSHPKDLSDKLIETVANTPKVCENFHLPVQAGADSVLARMNRGYTREDYLALVERIRAAIPDAVITTDIIVGFPGESDEDFEQTLDLVRRVRWDSAYMFMYSPREGTPAARFPDDVSLEVKKRRLQHLIELQEAISLEINRSTIGKREEILVEGPSKRSESRMMGRTRGDKVAIFSGRHDLAGKTIEVTITDAAAHTLFGEIAGNDD